MAAQDHRLPASWRQRVGTQSWLGCGTPSAPPRGPGLRQGRGCSATPDADAAATAPPDVLSRRSPGPRATSLRGDREGKQLSEPTATAGCGGGWGCRGGKGRWPRRGGGSALSARTSAYSVLHPASLRSDSSLYRRFECDRWTPQSGGLVSAPVRTCVRGEGPRRLAVGRGL